MYVPAGYVVLEDVTKGPLCFGVRKSFFHNTMEEKAAYSLCIEMMKADKRDCQKMDEIIGCFSQAPKIE